MVPYKFVGFAREVLVLPVYLVDRHRWRHRHSLSTTPLTLAGFGLVLRQWNSRGNMSANSAFTELWEASPSLYRAFFFCAVRISGVLVPSAADLTNQPALCEACGFQ